MLTGKVLTMAFLMEQDGDVSNEITQLVQDMSKEELAEVKHYIEAGTFIRHD